MARPSIAGAVRESISETLAQAEARAKRGGCCTTAKTNKLNDEFVFLRLPIRVLGVVLIVFSILEFGVGGFCYSYLSSNNFVGAGAFWAGLTYLILGVLSVHMRTKAVAIAAIIMCFVAWVVGLGAVGLDGTFSTLINNKLACSQMISGTGYGPKYSDYGNAKSYTAADVCYFQAYPNSQNNICYCSASVIPTTDISASPTCINLVLNPKVASGSCGDVFVKFGPALKASAGLCGFLVFVSFFQLLLLSTALCCERRPAALAAQEAEAEAEAAQRKEREAAAAAAAAAAAESGASAPGVEVTANPAAAHRAAQEP